MPRKQIRASEEFFQSKLPASTSSTTNPLLTKTSALLSIDMDQSLAHSFNPTRDVQRYKDLLGQPIHTRGVQDLGLRALSNRRAMLDGVFQCKFDLPPPQLGADFSGTKPLEISPL